MIHPKRTFEIEVSSLDDGDGPTLWLGLCGDIGVVCEAKTLDGLFKRAWAMAPELAVMNGQVTDESQVSLVFKIISDTPRLAAL